MNPENSAFHASHYTPCGQLPGIAFMARTFARDGHFTIAQPNGDCLHYALHHSGVAGDDPVHHRVMLTRETIYAPDAICGATGTGPAVIFISHPCLPKLGSSELLPILGSLQEPADSAQSLATLLTLSPATVATMVAWADAAAMVGLRPPSVTAGRALQALAACADHRSVILGGRTGLARGVSAICDIEENHLLALAAFVWVTGSDPADARAFITARLLTDFATYPDLGGDLAFRAAEIVRVCAADPHNSPDWSSGQRLVGSNLAARHALADAFDLGWDNHDPLEYGETVAALRNPADPNHAQTTADLRFLVALALDPGSDYRLFDHPTGDAAMAASRVSLGAVVARMSAGPGPMISPLAALTEEAFAQGDFVLRDYAAFHTQAEVASSSSRRVASR